MGEHESAEHAPDFLVSPKTVSVVGAPMQWGQPFSGTDTGPELMRKAGLRGAVANLGWRFEDKGDIDMSAKALTLSSKGSRLLDLDPSKGAALNCALVGEANRLVYEEVKKRAEDGSFVLTLGGDHSVGAGTVSIASLLLAWFNSCCSLDSCSSDCFIMCAPVIHM
jgi:arginase